MRTAAEAVSDAKEQLRQAEANAANERKAEARRQLEEVRSTGRKLKREFDSIVKAVRQLEYEVGECDREIASYNSAINNHAPLDPAEFPSERQLAEWQTELDELIAARDQAVAHKREVMDKGPSRIRAVELDQQITHLRYTQDNLLRIIRGEKIGGSWEGGIGPA